MQIQFHENQEAVAAHNEIRCFTANVDASFFYICPCLLRRTGWTLVFDVSLGSTSNGSLLTGFINVDTFEDTIRMFSDMNNLWTVALFASDRWPASSCHDCGITGYWQAVNDPSEQIPEPATIALLGLGLLNLVATRGRSMASIHPTKNQRTSACPP